MVFNYIKLVNVEIHRNFFGQHMHGFKKTKSIYQES